jgi:hypothetical protein
MSALRITSIVFFVAVVGLSAQEPTVPPVPTDAAQRFAAAWQYTQATARMWVNEQAESARTSSISPEQLKSYLHKAIQVRFGAQKPGPQAVELLVQLVFTQVAQDAEKDLRATVADMKRRNELKATIRELADSLRGAVDRTKGASATERLALNVMPKLTTISRLEATIGMEKPIAERSVATLDDMQALLTELESHYDQINKELSAEAALRVQNAMTRYQQTLQMLANIMKATHSVAANIVQNLR